MDDSVILTSEAIQMLLASVMQYSRAQISEIETECLLNAIARAQSGVLTGVSQETRK